MRTPLFFPLLLFLLCLQSFAQGTLQFNRTIIVGNTQDTVPSGKVWKVTSIFGKEFNLNRCLSGDDPTIEYLGLKCNPYYSGGVRSIVASYFISEVFMNGVGIVNEISAMPSNTTVYTTVGCSGGTTTSAERLDYTCANQSPNYNILPMWLPAGTTFKTGGPHTFATVVEFNIVP